MQSSSGIGLNIQQECSKQHITVEDLSKRAGLSVGRVYEIQEAGGHPRLSEILRIAEALDIPYATLMVNPRAPERPLMRSIVTGSLRMHASSRSRK